METNPTAKGYSLNMFNNIELYKYDILINGEKICGIINTNKAFQQMTGRHNASNQADRMPKLVDIACPGCDYNHWNFPAIFFKEDPNKIIEQLAEHGILFDAKKKRNQL